MDYMLHYFPNIKRGAPLVWAMINGEKHTGISLFQMDKGLIQGDILGQEKVKICENDTIKSLYSKIEKSELSFLRNTIPKLAAGTIKRIKQDKNNDKVWPQRSPKDGLINWNNSTLNVDRFIRAQTKPYPGAFTIINNIKIRIWKSQNIFYKSRIIFLRVNN